MKKFLSLIFSVLLVCCMVGCSNEKTNDSSNSSKNDNGQVTLESDVKDNVDTKKESEELFVIFDRQKKDAKSMKLNLVGEKIAGFNRIAKGEILFNNGSYRYKVNLPIINDTTYSLNGFSTDVELESDYIDISYHIIEKNTLHNQRNIDKSIVEEWLANDIEDYGDKNKNWENQWGNELKKHTEVNEENGVIAYAKSLIWHGGTTNKDSIRVNFIKKDLENRVSEDEYYLEGFISFDMKDYDKAIETMKELGDILNYDFVKLIEEVK